MMSACTRFRFGLILCYLLQETLAVHDTDFINNECKKMTIKNNYIHATYKYHATKSKELKVPGLHSVTHRVYNVPWNGFIVFKYVTLLRSQIDRFRSGIPLW